eukprot:9972982-Heterocapsa_arctica.AAC.1
MHAALLRFACRVAWYNCGCSVAWRLGMDLSNFLALVPGSCDCVSESKASGILRACVRAAHGRP